MRLLIILLAICSSLEAIAATKCKVGDNWYPYDSVQCSPTKKPAPSDKPTTTTKTTSPLLKTEGEFDSDSRTICTKKWTKRDNLNSEMYSYCLRSQREDYQELITLDKYSNQSFYSDVAFPHCNQKWTKRGITNVSMLTYCLKQEVDGIEDVMYYRKKYGVNNVNAIVGDAIARYGSWNMAAYQVKQAFD